MCGCQMQGDDDDDDHDVNDGDGEEFKRCDLGLAEAGELGRENCGSEIRGGAVPWLVTFRLDVGAAVGKASWDVECQVGSLAQGPAPALHLLRFCRLKNTPFFSTFAITSTTKAATACVWVSSTVFCVVLLVFIFIEVTQK